MTRYQDLDLERKIQLLLNLRIQALMVDVLAEGSHQTPEAVITAFHNQVCADVFSLSESEMNEHLKKLDEAVDYCVQHEAKAVIRSNLN